MKGCYTKTLCAIAMFATLEACHGHSASTDANYDDAVPRQIVTEVKQLQVGQVAEATLTGGNGDATTISLAAPLAKLDWNLHGRPHSSAHTLAVASAPPHDGDETIREEFDVMNVNYTFAPSKHADWRLVIRNKDTAPMTIMVTIGLHGNMQWINWR